MYSVEYSFWELEKCICEVLSIVWGIRKMYMCSVKYSLKELDNTYFIKESIVWRIRKRHIVYVVKYSVKNM